MTAFSNKFLIGKSTNDELVKSSSSGGIFGELAQNYLSNGGYVVGAVFSEDGTVKEKLIDSLTDLYTITGSKYAQSVTGNIYTIIENKLSNGKRVLFCGTPCQCAALDRCLCNSLKHNLLMVDFICHGVPSNKTWLSYIEHKSGDNTPIDYSFRDKRLGASNYGVRISFKEDDAEEYFCKHQDDAYMKLFLSNTILRPSCYRCFAKGKNRSSDITLGDFWGNTRKNQVIGESLIAINSVKGKEAFDSIQGITVKELSEKEALQNNPNYYKSCGQPGNRTKVIEMLIEDPITVFSNLDCFISNNNWDKIRRFIVRTVNSITHNRYDCDCYLETKKKSACCGCGLCMNVCHKNAISMVEDSEGFLYPSVDESKCVHCNRCVSRCRMIKEGKNEK